METTRRMVPKEVLKILDMILTFVLKVLNSSEGIEVPVRTYKM